MGCAKDCKAPSISFFLLSLSKILPSVAKQKPSITLGNKLLLKGPLFNPFPFTDHLAPHGAKNEQAFSGVIVKSERPSGPLFSRSGHPVFTFGHKIETLSPLSPFFAHSDPHSLTFWHKNRGPESANALIYTLRPEALTDLGDPW